MNWVFIVAFLIVVGALAFRDRQGPSPYRGRVWKQAFPDAPKERIRKFLECFVDGMAFSQKTKLKFHPNDQALDIYIAIYGGYTPRADAMECETFLQNLQAEFGKSLNDLFAFWHLEVTLGDLFKFVSTQQSSQPTQNLKAVRVG